MGGIGSGRGLRPNAWKSKKTCVGRLPGLNVQRALKLYNASPNSGLTFGNFRLEIKESVINLSRDDNEKVLTDRIKIAAVPCNYGGVRYFGHCPACEKRAVTLFLYKNMFACRSCFRMVYYSQNATCAYRLLVKLKKVGQKINNDVYTKPKWMRQKTFERLRDDHFDLDEKLDIAHFFSLRNNYSVDKILDEFGCSISAAEAWGIKHFGTMWQ